MSGDGAVMLRCVMCCGTANFFLVKASEARLDLFFFRITHKEYNNFILFGHVPTVMWSIE